MSKALNLRRLRAAEARREARYRYIEDERWLNSMPCVEVGAYSVWPPYGRGPTSVSMDPGFVIKETPPSNVRDHLAFAFRKMVEAFRG